MNLILFGFKSCGKTTIGRAVAKRLGCSFFDTDHLLEDLYYKRTGEKKGYREIYKLIGEKEFRFMERDVLKGLDRTDRAVIAVGGGLILDPENVALLAKLGRLVYLRVNKQTLKKRILERSLPAYLDSSNPEESFEKMYQERLPIYEKILALPIDLETQTQDQAIEEICLLGDHG